MIEKMALISRRSFDDYHKERRHLIGCRLSIF